MNSMMLNSAVTNYLVPPHEQLAVWVLEETTNISPAEAKPANGQGQTHGNGYCEVAPLCSIVSRPDSGVPLRPGKPRAGQDEWSFAVGWISLACSIQQPVV